MSTSPLSIHGPFGTFADRLLALDLPDLPSPARAATVAFVVRRAAQLPAPLRLGVTALAGALGVGQRALGADRTTVWLGRTRLPLVGELARLVRALGFAYVWESWPDSSPTGGRPQVAR